MIITNAGAKPQDLLPGAKSKKSKLFSFLADFLESILMFSTGTPLHLVILTDWQSLEEINMVKSGKDNMRYSSVRKYRRVLVGTWHTLSYTTTHQARGRH